METTIICLLMLQKYISLKQKITAYPLYLQNISKDFLDDDMEETGLNGYVYDFSVDYFSINVGTIQDIHKCFMKKNNIKHCSGVLKKCLLDY